MIYRCPKEIHLQILYPFSFKELSLARRISKYFNELINSYFFNIEGLSPWLEEKRNFDAKVKLYPLKKKLCELTNEWDPKDIFKLHSYFCVKEDSKIHFFQKSDLEKQIELKISSSSRLKEWKNKHGFLLSCDNSLLFLKTIPSCEEEPLKISFQKTICGFHLYHETAFVFCNKSLYCLGLSNNCFQVEEKTISLSALQFGLFSCIQFFLNKLYVGFENGCVVTWELPTLNQIATTDPIDSQAENSKPVLTLIPTKDYLALKRSDQTLLILDPQTLSTFRKESIHCDFSLIKEGSKCLVFSGSHWFFFKPCSKNKIHFSQTVKMKTPYELAPVSFFGNVLAASQPYANEIHLLSLEKGIILQKISYITALSMPRGDSFSTTPSISVFNVVTCLKLTHNELLATSLRSLLKCTFAPAEKEVPPAKKRKLTEA